MIKTLDVVKKFLLRSDTAQLAANEGLLNISAFARKIQPQVEAQTMKPVTVPTITVALYRLLDKYSLRKFKPVVKLNQITVHSQVLASTYPKTAAVLKKTTQFLSQAQLSQQKHFCTVTRGPDEVTIIAAHSLKKLLLKILGKPAAIFEELVAVSVNFDQKYLEIPNMIYTVLASLAVRRINVVEIVSTYTSLTFVIQQKELERVIEALKGHL